MVGNARWNLAPQPQQQGLNLGGADPNAQYQMPRLPWSQNPMITTAALGLLGGRTLNEGLQNVAQNAPAGLAANTAMRRDMAGQRDAATTRAAMNAVIKLKSGVPLTPADQAAIDAAPEVKLKFGMPAEPDWIEIGGRPFNKTTGTFGEQAGGGGFTGTALDAQDSQIIVRGQTDDAYRATPEYKIAWSRQFETPRMVQGSDESGKMISTPILPSIPGGLKGPVGGSVAAPTSPDQTVPTPTDASGTGVRTGKPVVTGTTKPTEQQLRQRQIYANLKPEVATIEKNWSSLSDLKSQVAKGIFGNTGLDNLITSPEYQKAYNATRASVSQILYSLSGANANPGEVENQIDNLMPKPFETKEATDAKLARIKTMVESTRIAGGPTSTDGPISADEFMNQ
jgi:hypothetical protein